MPRRRADACLPEMTLLMFRRLPLMPLAFRERLPLIFAMPFFFFFFFFFFASAFCHALSPCHALLMLLRFDAIYFHVIFRHFDDAAITLDASISPLRAIMSLHTPCRR